MKSPKQNSGDNKCDNILAHSMNLLQIFEYLPLLKVGIKVMFVGLELIIVI